MKISKYYFKVLENKRVIFLTDGLHDELIYKEKEIGDKGEVTNFTLNKDVKPLADEKYDELINAKDAIFYENNDFVIKVKPEMPQDKYLKYMFNENTWQWELVTTKEELQQTKTNLILEHNKKRKEISALHEEAEFFDVSESVTKANCELEEIRAKINEIDKVIEEMNKQQ